MAQVLQLRRGTTAQNDAFTGAVAEVSVDTDRDSLRVHDGTTMGGKEIAPLQVAVPLLPAASSVSGSDEVPVLQGGLAKRATKTQILDGIVNSNISASAAIAHSKLAPVTAGQVILGNSSNVATATAVSGDVIISDSGVVTIANNAITSAKILNGTIVDGDISGSANISGSKMDDSSITASKLQNPQYTGFRNRIINGDMRIDQRNAGASQSITAASPSYTVDRFIVRPIGGTVTGQRIAGTGSTQYVYQITGGASVTQLQFEQKIESSNSHDLAGSNVAISADISNSLLTTANWILYYANSTDNFSANTVIGSGSWTVSSTISRYSATVAVPAAATTGLYLIIFVGAQTSGTFVIGNVQLEAGSVATPFERRPIGTELALCQRYYYRITVGAGQSFGMADCSATTGALGIVHFPVTMRAAPTALEQSGTANQYSIGHGGTVTQCSSVPTFSADSSTSLAATFFTVASGLTLGRAGRIRSDSTNGANAFLAWSAEL